MKRKLYADIKPSKRQIKWQEIEFYGFIHFGINTMTGSEWGTGNESPEIFNPKNINTDDWIKSLKMAGMKGVILTCKHHDGFCLWPSDYTDHTVAYSPWRGGNGDLVQEVSDSCEKYDLKFGIYLSPWDKHETSYGQGKKYDDFFVNQLTELLTNYGDIFSVWFDGANGEGPNGKKQEYDWERYYKVIRKYQPNAVISISGPDVRWVGNEAGMTRRNEWSVVPDSLFNNQLIQEESQKEDNRIFSTQLTNEEEDLGSRKVLDQHKGDFIWYPAEVDVSIRPGWFYHKSEDHKVKTAEELFSIYKNSVGNNASLLLNIPPNQNGEITDYDKKELKELGKKIRKFYDSNVLKGSKVKFSSNHDMIKGETLLNLFNSSRYWKNSSRDNQPKVEIKLNKAQLINHLILREFIAEGQRIERIKIKMFLNDKEVKNMKVEAIGNKKIIEIEKIKIDKIILLFPLYRNFITLQTFGALDYI